MIRTHDLEAIVIRALVHYFDNDMIEGEDALLHLTKHDFSRIEFRDIFKTISAMFDNSQQITIQSLTLNLPADSLAAFNNILDEHPLSKIENIVTGLKEANKANKKLQLMKQCVDEESNIDNQKEKKDLITNVCDEIEKLQNQCGDINLVPTTMVHIYDDLEQGKIELRKRYYTGDRDWETTQ